MGMYMCRNTGVIIHKIPHMYYRCGTTGHAGIVFC